MKERKPLPTYIRDEIVFRDKNTCQHCKKEAYNGVFPPEVHHKDNNPENNELNNLILLCYDCHKFVHSNYPQHGRPRIMGGKLKGETSTDYFLFHCPAGCIHALQLDIKELREDGVLLIGVKCFDCGFKDLIKIKLTDFNKIKTTKE